MAVVVGREKALARGADPKPRRRWAWVTIVTGADGELRARGINWVGNNGRAKIEWVRELQCCADKAQPCLGVELLVFAWLGPTESS